MTILAIALALIAPVKQSDKPPSMHDVCYSVTNYWPFNDAGELVALNGQADEWPHYTANMTLITGTEQAWAWVAAPLPLVGHSVTVPGYGTFPVNDTFGHPAYQAGVFWHDGWGQYVIGIDIFTPQPVYDLVCGGTINN